MSAEEKAVRDALAVVNADTGVKQAQDILSSAGYNPLSGMTTTAPGSTTPNVAYDPLTGKIIPGQTSIGGYVNNPSGGNVTPPQNPIVPVVPTAAKIIPNVAYDTISKILESYNITGLASVLDNIRKEYPEASSTDVLTLLQFDDRYNAKFNERFSANAARQKAGMKVLSPAEYLALEQGYKKTFSAYSLNNFANQDYYNKLISNDVSTTELTDRVNLAFDRVLNDEPVQTAFKTFYPSLTTTDIVTAMLDPVNQFPVLERKVKAAEVGGAALRQGLYASELATTPTTSSGYTNVTSATLGSDVLAQQGVTKAGAEAGYQAIAQVLPTAEKLSSIYGGQTEQYGRLQAEQEKLQGLASAARKRQQLSALETAQFQGSSGVGPAGLSTSYLKKSSSAGLF